MYTVYKMDENASENSVKVLPHTSHIRYICQVTVLFCIIAFSLYNLSVKTTDRELWVSLLSSCTGYLLPAPKFPKKR